MFFHLYNVYDPKGNLGESHANFVPGKMALKSDDNLQLSETSVANPVSRILPVKVRRSNQLGGYDCEFLVEPPSIIQTECSVCLHILRTPKLIDCCGHCFCSTCIDRIEDDDNCCPLCNAEEYTLVRNKGLERALNELEVKCSYFREGCCWVGKLGDLDAHISAEELNSGCSFVEVECQHVCGDYFERRSITQHEDEECLKRPFDCIYCHNYFSTFEIVIQTHYPVCDSFPVPCPNNCDSPNAIERRELADHVECQCPLTVVDCAFRYAGCEVRLPRRDIPEHLMKENLTHLSLMAVLTNELLRKQNDLEKENCSLKAEVSTLQEKLRLKVECLGSHSGLPPCNIFMSGFYEHQIKGDVWFSSHFFSHSRGYKMCVSVYANGTGHGKSTHVSLFVHLMQGEFDDELKWPFRGSITVQLLNQVGNATRREKTIGYHISSDDHRANRVTLAQRGRGKGSQCFIAHDELRALYLRNDQLHFCISEVLVSV